MLACGRERLWWWLHPYAWLISGCLVFLHWHFPPRSPPSCPFHPSLHSQQQPSPWNCSAIPKLQLPATAPSRRPVFLSGICMAVARTVWFSFHLGYHRSAVSLLVLNWLRQSPHWWDWTPASVSPSQGRSSPGNSSVFPLVPPPYRILHSSIYSFPLVRSFCPLSAGVLPALLCLKVYSWCIHGERCTPLSTYSSAILFSSKFSYFKLEHVLWWEDGEVEKKKKKKTNMSWENSSVPGICLSVRKPLHFFFFF